MALDEQALLVAEEEGMDGGRPHRIDEVLEAIGSMESADESGPRAA
ncbi:MAG: hypothetical protein R3F34_18770 [Planctomycetota bacterium]